MAEHYHRDYETRSVVDLKKTGARVYMQHPTTSIWCMAYSVGDGPVNVWDPGQPVPLETQEAVLEGYQAWAHNNQFEAIVEKYIAGPRHGFPIFDQTQQRCTMVGAYALALPGSLEQAAPAAGLSISKDMVGKRLMMQMSRPRKVEYAAGVSSIPFSAVRVAEMNADGWEIYEDGQGRHIAKVQWWNDADKIARLKAYCADDVHVERALEKRLRPLAQSEQALWHLDQRINERGCLVDVELAAAAKSIVKQAQANLDEQMRKLTDHRVSRCSNRNEIVAWVRAQGVECDSINKAALETLLEEDSPIPPHVRKVLLTRQEAAKASVAKIDALLLGTSPDTGRACDLAQFHAATTGRWAGRRAQWQNVKRPDEQDIDTLIDVVATGDYDYCAMMYGHPLSAVADILRGLIKAAPGRRIVAADLSNIEGRVLAWLAGETWKIEAFRAYDQGTGPDLYIKSYAETFRTPLFGKKDPRRQIGKTMELAGGFQGGHGAYLKFLTDESLANMVGFVREAVDADEWEEAAAKYKGGSLGLTEWTTLAIVIAKWREKHPRIKQFWSDIEAAAVAAVKDRGSVQRLGKAAFKVAGSFLMMRLPSGRFLSYPYPEVREIEVPWGGTKEGLTFFSTIDVSNKSQIVDDEKNGATWARIKTYGGKLTNNITQATARDVIAHAMPRLEAAGYPIILTVHDEIVSEVPVGHGSVEEMEEIMCNLPDWAAGLPVAAEGFEGERYRK